MFTAQWYSMSCMNTLVQSSVSAAKGSQVEDTVKDLSLRLKSYG